MGATRMSSRLGRAHRISRGQTDLPRASPHPSVLRNLHRVRSELNSNATPDRRCRALRTTRRGFVEALRFVAPRSLALGGFADQIRRNFERAPRNSAIARFGVWRSCATRSSREIPTRSDRAKKPHSLTTPRQTDRLIVSFAEMATKFAPPLAGAVTHLRRRYTAPRVSRTTPEPRAGQQQRESCYRALRFSNKRRPHLLHATAPNHAQARRH